MFKTIAKQLVLTLVLLVTTMAPLLAPATAHAQLNTIVDESTLDEKTALPACLSIGDGSVMGCIGQFLYWGLWWPSHWLAARAGGFLDYFLYYSINSTTYRGVPFIDPETASDQKPQTTTYIQEGWEIVRDISNIAFVFALLYIGLSFVVGNTIGSMDPKKLLIYVIVMALIINFSLFLSRIVVDAGNILAKTMYNQINLVGKNASGQYFDGPDGVKSVGIMLISLANPQALILNQTSGNAVIVGDTTENNAVYFILVTIGAIIFNVFLIYLFLAVSFYFIGRIVTLYYSMIFAPMAFATMTLPKGTSIKYIGFNSWLSTMVASSFMAPVYLFFLYLTIKFLELGIPINPNVSGSSEVAQLFMSIAIPFALAIGFLVIGLKTAKNMSGEVGRTVASVATKAVVGGAGLALAGTALAGRAAISTATKSIARSETLRNAATSGKWRPTIAGRTFNLDSVARGSAKALLKGSDKLRKTETTDLRKTKAFSAAASLMGGVGSLINETPADFSKGPALKYTSVKEMEKARHEKRTKELEEDENLYAEMTEVDKKRQDDAARDHNKGLNADDEQSYNEAVSDAEEAFRRTAHYQNLIDDHERAQELKKWRDDFDANYANGIVEQVYDDQTGEAVLALDDTDINTNLRAIREELAFNNLRETEQYRNASDDMQITMEENLQNLFDDRYDNHDRVVTNVRVDETTGAVASDGEVNVDDGAYGWSDGIRARRYEALVQEFQASDWYRSNTDDDAAADALLDLQEAFADQYDNNHRVVTQVGDDGVALTGTNETIDVDDDSDRSSETFNQNRYRRMKTSKEIERERKQLFAQLQLRNATTATHPYRNLERREASELYARKELTDADKEKKKTTRIDLLNSQLNELNDTMATWMTVADANDNTYTFRQMQYQTDADGNYVRDGSGNLIPTGMADIGFDDLNLNHSFEVNGQQFQDFNAFVSNHQPASGTVTSNNTRLNNPRMANQSAQLINNMVSQLEGSIAALQARSDDIKQRAKRDDRDLTQNEVVQIGAIARQIASAKNVQNTIRGGINKRNQLNTSITNARK